MAIDRLDGIGWCRKQPNRYGWGGAKNIFGNFEGVINGRTSKGLAVKIVVLVSVKDTNLISQHFNGSGDGSWTPHSGVVGDGVTITVRTADNKKKELSDYFVLDAAWKIKEIKKIKIFKKLC